ncbi:hypothetical protein BDK51DRAFT_51560, partial [Blyttiomyces helicus]
MTSPATASTSSATSTSTSTSKPGQFSSASPLRPSVDVPMIAVVGFLMHLLLPGQSLSSLQIDSAVRADAVAVDAKREGAGAVLASLDGDDCQRGEASGGSVDRWIALADSREKGSNCSDLRASAPVSRAWEPSASARIWTHGRSSHEGGAAEIHRLRPQEPWEAGGDRAHPRDPLQWLVTVDWHALKGSIMHVSPAVSTVAVFLTLCPHLVTLSVPTPFIDHRDCSKYHEHWDADAAEDVQLASTYDFDLTATLRLRLLGWLFTDFKFCTLLLRSAAWPRLDPASFRNLEVLEVLDTEADFLVAFLSEVRPPLRRPTLLCDLRSSAHEPLALLLSCPTITNLELVTDQVISNNAIALLEQHLPLDYLGLLDRRRNPRKPLPEGSFTSQALQNLKVVDLGYSVDIDDALLSCIAESCPRLESLAVQSFWRYRGKPHMLTFKKIAVIAEVKRGCPNLRHVDIGMEGDRERFEMAQLKPKTRQFLEDLGIDISLFASSLFHKVRA